MRAPRPAELALSFRIPRASRTAIMPRLVKIMIDSVGQNLTPKRIVLGSDSCTVIQKALTERLAALACGNSVDADRLSAVATFKHCFTRFVTGEG